MLKVLLALALAPAAALTPREELAAAANAAQSTWKAYVGSDRDKPLGSSRHLYGVREGSRAEFEALTKIPGSGFAMAPKISAAAAADIPDEFQSADAWPNCASTINDIRDQSNCGCCWAFGAASAASDRACIASNSTITIPFSAEDVCFNAQSTLAGVPFYPGCMGGSVHAPWSYIRTTGVVSGNQNLNDSAVAEGLPPSDPFYKQGFCSPFSLPHCHHHGDQGADPYPAEGEPGCPSQRSPLGPTECDPSAVGDHRDFAADKYKFDGMVTGFPNDEATIQAAIMGDGPVEAAFTVYSDFETYESGIYQRTSAQSEGGHAIRIVGWGVENDVKYWTVANSWNPYWGEKGFFRILRGVDECGIESSVTASAAGSTWSKVGA